MAIWGILAHELVQRGQYAGVTLMGGRASAAPSTLFLDAGVRFDSWWYAGIALHGYSFTPGRDSSIAFYPLYPLLTRAAMLVVGNVFVAGVAVSTICLLLAVYVLYLWLQDHGYERFAPMTTVLLLCFPFSYFFVSMYSESLFLLLALATFVCFERGQWELAAGCAFLAALSRPTGIILIPCLLLLAIRTGHNSTWRRWLPVLAAPAAWICFASYQWLAFGTPTASIEAAVPAPWSRSLRQGLSDILLHHSRVCPVYLAGMLLLALAFLAFVPIVYRRFGAPYAIFAAMAVLLPMASGLISTERYVLVDFPVFACAAQLRHLYPLILACTGMVYLAVFYAIFIHGAQIF
jgi:hypothetical protein